MLEFLAKKVSWTSPEHFSFLIYTLSVLICYMYANYLIFRPKSLAEYLSHTHSTHIDPSFTPSHPSPSKLRLIDSEIAAYACRIYNLGCSICATCVSKCLVLACGVIWKALVLETIYINTYTYAKSPSIAF